MAGKLTNVIDELPAFDPFMLRCLTYKEAVVQASMGNCAIARQHWCSPVVVAVKGRLWFDDDGEREPWSPTPEDRKANDWMMVRLTKGAE